jgi:cephalosporin hydroxylase
MVWYITCWSGSTAHLVEEYMKVTQGGKRIIVNNNSDKKTHEKLKTYVDSTVTIITLDQNIGFALGNNQGFAHLEKNCQEDDIVCFVNSDVVTPPHFNKRRQGLRFTGINLTDSLESLCRSSSTSALYGPNFGYQHVHGSFMPYIEGWCIAGTYKTWRSLIDDTWLPWNRNYQAPYWEDNDLSLRALTRGVFLIHADLPIIHLGSQTAGPVIFHTSTYEENRSQYIRFVQDVHPSNWANLPTYKAYMHYRSSSSDISHHLETLASLSRGFVIELGTRSGVSTTALLHGVERYGGHVISIDVMDCSEVYRGNRNWTFLQADSRDVRAKNIVKNIMRVMNYQRPTMVFIDTLHTYHHVMEELNLWSTLDPDFIIVHDTESFPGVKGAIEEWLVTIPATRAMEEDLSVRSNYDCWFVAPNNGLAIMKAK